MAENVAPPLASANEIVYKGADKLLDPEWIGRNVVNSHGADDRLQTFYCTTYGTSHNLEQHHSPLVRVPDYKTSGWTLDHVTQPRRFPPGYKRSQTGDGADMVSTMYSSAYQRPPLKEIDFVNVFAKERPTFPDNSVLTDVTGTREKTASATKVLDKEKKESVYTVDVANAPKEWMEKEVDADHQTICDRQSGYLYGNPCHSYFVYPEMMKSNIQQRSTVYRQCYQTPKVGEHENMMAVRKSGDPRYRTQFNSFEGTIWQHEFPNRSRFPRTGEKETERFRTQYNDTHQFQDWKTIQDIMVHRRPVGAPPLESSGYVINEPEVPVLSDAFHESKSSRLGPAKWPSHPVKRDWTTTYVGSFVGKPLEERAETGHFRAFGPTHHITKQPHSADDYEQNLLDRSGIGKGHEAMRRLLDCEKLGKPPGFEAVHWNRLTENTKMIPPF